MKIVMMIDWFLYYTVELVNALSQEHEVLFVTRDHNKEISSHNNKISVDEFLDQCLDKRIIREKLNYRLRDFRNLKEVIRVYRRIKGFNPDVLHVQENSDWRIMFIASLVGFDKIILTVHDVVTHPGDMKNIMRTLTYIFRKKVSKIIVHGNYLKDQMLSKSKKFKNKINVIPHGALEIYKHWDKKTVGKEDNTILFFGRFSHYKGIDVLINAVRVIEKEIPNIKVIIAGRGENFKKYENLIEDKKHFEIFNRFISNHEVPMFFRRASLVVLPYREASQSGVIPIAYVFGKPVVVSRVGSIPEVVEDGKTGFIVPPNNPEELAYAIIKILKNPELQKNMSYNALEMAKSELSFASIAKKTTLVYASM
jgi:glycosyltransferase involved in cell wall biosynthesis